MLGSLFNPENAFWSMFSKIADVLALSLLWVICSLPLVTLGAATAALYDASVKCVRRGEHSTLTRFFRTFRRELVPASMVTVLWGGLLLLLSSGLRLAWAGMRAEQAGAAVMLAGYFVLLMIPFGALCWMFPLLSRFTFGPGGLIRMALRLTLAYLPYTAVIVVVTLAAGVAVWLLWVPVLVVPCLTVLLWSLAMERVFRKYTPEESAPGDGPEEEN